MLSMGYTWTKWDIPHRVVDNDQAKILQTYWYRIKKYFIQRHFWLKKNVGPSPTRGIVGVCCNVCQVAAKSSDSARQISSYPEWFLGYGMSPLWMGIAWASMWGWAKLTIVKLDSVHDLGSGTSPPERGWTLFQSEVGHAERWWAGVGILVSPWPDAYILEFSVISHFPFRSWMPFILMPYFLSDFMDFATVKELGK